ncbi:MAG: lipoprotein-releasing ABC transporter permease subunit [Proteobacteria bacterium]|nr:lipoprotein-releasing ABC transporter permease subunit [Desulfobulbaceae bacterium]MBU4152744.1 lipoprotein-releasing ABC transporter permease subunit [Pseudomonadota bacterium]
MRFEWFVCLRYLKAKRKQNFISLISVISVAGVAIGVMALIIVLSVMTGFTDELRDKILGINSHIVVQKLEGQISDYSEMASQLDAIPGVVGTTPYVVTQTMITSADAGTGAIVRGIDPQSANRVLDLDRHLKGGAIADLELPVGRGGVPGIILGNELAKQLRVFPGSRIRLMSTAGALTPIGILPRIKTCEVIGIFKTDMYEYDSAMAFVSMPVAQDFLELGQDVHGVEVRLTDIFKAHEMARQIEEQLGQGTVARDWISTNKGLFSALELEKKSMFIIITLVVVVAAFNIVSTLIMVVMEKNKDIAILKSMGARASQIMKIFIYEGLIIGISGTVAGVLGGVAVCDVLRRYKFIKLPEVYPISTLPVEVVPQDVLLISASAVLITLLATLYPSWQAAKIDPATALRYE